MPRSTRKKRTESLPIKEGVILAISALGTMLLGGGGKSGWPVATARGIETMGKLELSGRAAGRCVVFGEVLYDCFVDGQTTLGGAPFNVAWHLQGLGLEPLLISRIGRDEPGERILQRMAEWGMDRRGVQRDSKFPTGQVTVTTENGQPTFDIHANQAYDHIEGENAVATVHGVPPSLLYHGCLALRSDQSRSAWRQMCTSFPKTPRFLDINFRPSWWTDRRVSEAISGANWVKLNDEELFLLTSTDGKEGSSHLDAAHKICEHYTTTPGCSS